ncbi:oxidoreductase [Actinophytocola xinjiangensis]|uniref:Oxidoreductase n=1 Tax=Actinophytocola xinjiangensis TaxID=485602 RepID=A0A7Z1AV42_9PSEU|nr:Gfo/Idh/MocA family oxidoreductase [Actinophytocola xinjiangensis]OLF06817.1 oxidoreductase [Actinophytocola xinjiangensis]
MSVTHLTASGRGLGAESRTLRVGVVGAGFMGRVHAEAARRAGATVVAATASSPVRADAAAAAIGAQRGYPGVGELLDAAEIDVLHICTPNVTHAPLAAAALAAGAHVVCEKPLATGVTEAGGLVSAATDRIATVPFVYRFHPMVRELRARLTAGEAGTLTTVTGGYLQDWLSRATDENWRIDSGQGGASRAFGDIGSHWSDLFEFVTGDRIARLSARTAVVHGRDGQRTPPTEDLAAVLFATTRGLLGTLVVSQVAAGRKNRLHLELSGTDASFAFDQEDPERLWVGRREGGQVLLRDPDTLHPSAARYVRVPAGHAQGYQDCFDAFVADTYAAVRGESPDGLPTFADGLRAVRVTDAVLTSSAADGAWVEVAP